MGFELHANSFAVCVTERDEAHYLETRPEASPPINASTSLTVTALKSPMMLCLRHAAAAAKLRACCGSSYLVRRSARP
jgi:hypothetical protein